MGTPLNEHGQVIVHQVPQAVMEHLPEEVRHQFDLRPIEYLPENDEAVLDSLFEVSEKTAAEAIASAALGSGNQCWVERVVPKDAFAVQPMSDPIPLTFFAMGRNTGKSLMTADLMEGFVKNDERRMETNDFFKGFYQKLNGTLLGYMGEAKPRKIGFNWTPELTIVGRKRHWLYPTQSSPIDYWKKDARQFRVPARRRAGFGAYKPITLQILRAPQPVDCAWEVYREEVKSRYGRYHNGHMLYLDDFPPGEMITVVYDTLRWVDPYQERASERRARLSSTADGNGKPRRKNGR